MQSCHQESSSSERPGVPGSMAVPTQSSPGRIFCFPAAGGLQLHLHLLEEHIDYMQIQKTGERGLKKLLEKGQTAPTEVLVQQLCQGALRIYSCWLLSCLSDRKDCFNHPAKCTVSSGDKALGFSTHSAVCSSAKPGFSQGSF